MQHQTPQFTHMFPLCDREHRQAPRRLASVVLTGRGDSRLTVVGLRSPRQMGPGFPTPEIFISLRSEELPVMNAMLWESRPQVLMASATDPVQQRNHQMNR